MLILSLLHISSLIEKTFSWKHIPDTLLRELSWHTSDADSRFSPSHSTRDALVAMISPTEWLSILTLNWMQTNRFDSFEFSFEVSSRPRLIAHATRSTNLWTTNFIDSTLDKLNDFRYKSSKVEQTDKQVGPATYQLIEIWYSVSLERFFFSFSKWTEIYPNLCHFSK